MMTMMRNAATDKASPFQGSAAAARDQRETNIHRQGIRMDSEHPSSQPQMNFLASANATAGPKPPLREVQARF